MSVTQPMGFRAAALAAGIKPSGKPDVCLIVRDAPGAAGAVVGSAMSFTTNAVVGAPVIIGRRQREGILAGKQRATRAVLINAGNSNAATGQPGVEAAMECCRVVAEAIGCEAAEVTPSSTGVIGRPLPVGKITSQAPTLMGLLARGEAADAAAARAIMTTDLVPKPALRRVTINGRTYTFGAIAKGSGMIAPRLDRAVPAAASARVPSATMLAFITTDAPIASVDLQAALDGACDESFNRISVDNHASCSDSVIVLSSGAAGGEAIVRGRKGFDAMAETLAEICRDLSEQVVIDGEGATRIFRVMVRGASSHDGAMRMAREVVNSPLVKCAIHGRDPNWGRIVTAAGNAGVAFDPAQSSLTIGPVEVYRAGVPMVEALSDPRLKAAMGEKRVECVLTVGQGPGEAWMIGCDLSKEYVSINAEYTT
ncbi:MAG: bifunctional glutamate N-acetyltransferase/amino-acid acetyltransferase ArgJ [Phycisphaerales bacterium]|jgi:glutamate N-acetyltransferase/amino-acid N-acetyltransferase|nr:bifunctional glutamate N-acetyltransferase/amino-acid acetyltransferase ArgJ [Phycisphaerales bacterium]